MACWVWPHSVSVQSATTVGDAPVYADGTASVIKRRLRLREESGFSLCGVSHLGPLVMHYILNVILSVI